MTDRSAPFATSGPGASSAPGAPGARPAAARFFGRYQLLRLIGKSERTMLWLGADTRNGHELMLSMPRVQPLAAALRDQWQQAVRRAMRLNHPHLAPVIEMGEQDRWPFVAYERHDCVTLAEMLSAKGLEAADVAGWASQALQGLAFAHDAGVTHGDIQPFMCAISDQGHFRWMGLEVACAAEPIGATADKPVARRPELHEQRDAAQRDVLAFGLLLHEALSGQQALGEPDIAQVIARMPPYGRDIVRLPWSLPRPIPDALRAIINRATDRQERQRYRNARTLQRALEGWLKAEASQGGGPLALLLDRLRTVGVLPALPGAAERAARLALMERSRTNELAGIVMEDPALAFELLRAVNGAAAQATGGGPVLTIRRAIAMIGLEGVRRSALSLRTWPGPLAPAAAQDLQRLVDHCKRVGAIARLIRPAGYDDEVVYLLALLQNLGRLVVQYHFPEEAGQIQRLMLPEPSTEPGKTEEPGMSAEAASFAVLGVDIEAIGAAVARQMGFDDAIQQMIRRHAEATAVRAGGDDNELLRATASCANEIGDALLQAGVSGANRRGDALTRVVQRYGRLLSIGMDDVVEAVKNSVRGPSAGAQAGKAANPDTTPAPGAARRDAAGSGPSARGRERVSSASAR